MGLKLLISLSMGSALFTGCSPKGETSLATVPTELVRTPTEQYAALAKSAKGLSIGPKASDYTVFVMFDPQCLHCAPLWEEFKGLKDTVKFVWVTAIG